MDKLGTYLSKLFSSINPPFGDILISKREREREEGEEGGDLEQSGGHVEKKTLRGSVAGRFDSVSNETDAVPTLAFRQSGFDAISTLTSRESWASREISAAEKESYLT